MSFIPESFKHPGATLRTFGAHFVRNHIVDDDPYQYAQDFAETRGDLNASLPADRQYLLKRQRELANAGRLERLQSLPGLPVDPVQ